ncbi:MAG TPA: hypothetical protein VKE51_06815 [Vicinamibacterales bacterium]|nr:hypothetical protein [Vicinamibacterales bacterium]
MATERGRKIVLGVLAVVLLVVAYRLVSTTSAPPASTSNRQAGTHAPAATAERAEPQQPTAPDVHLDALNADKPKPAGSDRDLFRFKPKAPPAPPPSTTKPAEGAAPPIIQTGPPPPPPLPPIPLKFIGIMGPENDKIAVLSDGRGGPIPGKEGDLVLGQYRILKIGVESVEVAYADGRGRITLRLSGQP